MINQIRQTLLRVPRVRYYTATTLRRTYKRASPVVKPKATTTTTTITTTKPAIRSIATEVTTPKEEAELVEAEETKPVEVNTSNRMSFHDAPLEASIVKTSGTINWSDSFHGLGAQPFSKEIADILLADVDVKDIEIKPDGLLYLPEIKYRRILNRAFGPGGWGLAPRTETYITPRQISREYGLICHGRLVSIARGEQDYFGGEDKITTALEGCKSNALMRCCKDLGIASELWDPSFIRAWKSKNCEEIFVEHITKKTKRRLWKLKSNKEMPAGYKKA